MSGTWWQRLRGWLGGAEPLTTAELEQLRASFKTRYNAFRLLLTANQRALEAMTDIEQALAGERTIDLAYIRQRYTQVATAVYSMIGNLGRIAPGKHSALVDRFREIQDRIDAVLEVPEPTAELPLVVPLAGLRATDGPLVGDKLAQLAELGATLGLAVPPGFASTTRAYHRFMVHDGLGAEVERLIQVGGTATPEQLLETSRRVQELIAAAPLPDDLARALSEHHRQLAAAVGPGVQLVLRSSALGEDAAGRSHAGIYESVFDVTGANLEQAWKRVIASKYSPQAITYRRGAGIRDDTATMCVGAMPVVAAVAGGVAYSRNPLDAADDSIVIHATPGLPRAVVAGSGAVEVFTVRREDQIADARPLAAPGLPAPRPGAGGPALTADQATELARLVLAVERQRGTPQDVEWALAPDGSFVLLQSRALEQLPAPVLADAPRGVGPVLLTGGVTASPGVGAGPVHRVRNVADLSGLPAGAVLLAHQALPDWALALERAAALVTERGGVAGHLATVAREFGVPALFGVDGALAALAPGQPVTVDATGRAIHAGLAAGLPAPRRRPRDRSTSPVHRALAAVADQIVPLGLLDPDAASFAAGACRTLHDITRFCHEQAVQEMFRFGTDHRFPQAAARQLRCGVPMQFWVIDLDDGIAPGATGSRYVELADVRSIPLLALWRGMVAQPWSGPPPADARGFMDALLQSAADPALDPAAPPRVDPRSYFMITRNFLSLQSRFGYHFTTVEALVGERSLENYASLQFKAGGAGAERRNRRARLIAEVLTEHQFRTLVDGDLLRARVDGLDRAELEQRLAALGHLLIHTRQLDMALVSEQAVEAHKGQLLEQLGQLGTSGPPEA